MLSGVWPRSLRARLTLLFSGVAAVTIVVAAVGVYRQIETAIWSQLDAALREEGELLATLPQGADELERTVALVAAETDLGAWKFVVVHGQDGKVLARAGRVPRRLMTSPPRRDAVTRLLWVAGQRRPFRLARYVDRGVTVVLGVDATPALRALAAMRRRLAVGGAAVLAVLASLAWGLTSRVTGELKRLAADVETIQAGTLERRLPRGATLEVDTLVVVLNRLLGRLETSVATLRRFTADAAHELRTPVAALRATLEVALTRDGGPERWRDGLLDAIEQAERLGRLAEDLLVLSAVEAGATQAQSVPVRLDRLAADVAGDLEPIAVEQQRQFHCEPGVETWVLGVPSLLERVVANLVDNAFRHTPVTSAVTVRVRRVGDRAELIVSDEGPGIAPEDRARMFERFGRGRGATPNGAGLGLALSREVAERHGGTLDVESDPRRGTQAVLSLPFVAAPTESAEAGRQAERARDAITAEA